jgi:aminoglycoside phosphotransferase (APT) family kinase protein
MAKSHLILAALAAEAAGGKNFISTRLTSDQTPGFDSAVLESDIGRKYQVLVPKAKQVESELKTELNALQLIRPLASSTLSVPEIIGKTTDGDGSSVVVLSFDDSKDIRLGSKNSESIELLAAELARVHSLSVTDAQQLEIQSYTPTELNGELVSEIDKLADTGKVPGVLLSRWERALEDIGLWRYRPTVIHGAINSDTVGTAGDKLVLRGFGSMRVSDPAEDFGWIAGGSTESVLNACFDQYVEIREADENLLKRAIFYSEVEIARWLSYCITSGDDRSAEAASADLENLAEDAQRSDLPSLEATSFIGLNQERDDS